MMILTSHKQKDTLIPLLLKVIDIQRRFHVRSMLETGTGWSGPKSLLHSPAGQHLRSYIESKLPLPCDVVGWGNYLEPGQMIGVHNHKAPGNIFSGVYYLTRAKLNIHGFGTPIKVILFDPGDLIIFPPETMHSVSPTDELRISIAFNASPK